MRKRYSLVWKKNNSYIDTNSFLLAQLLWYLTYADFLLDHRKGDVIITRGSVAQW